MNTKLECVLCFPDPGQIKDIYTASENKIIQENLRYDNHNTALVKLIIWFGTSNKDFGLKNIKVI